MCAAAPADMSAAETPKGDRSGIGFVTWKRRFEGYVPLKSYVAVVSEMRTTRIRGGSMIFFREEGCTRSAASGSGTPRLRNVPDATEMIRVPLILVSLPGRLPVSHPCFVDVFYL